MANSIGEFFARAFLKNEISPELDRITDELLSLSKTMTNALHPEMLVQETERIQELSKAFIEAGGSSKELADVLNSQLAPAVDKTKVAFEGVNTSSYNNFRAIGQADRITREFAAGGLTQGLNGLTMFGNTLTRLAVQENGFGNAINGLADSFMGPAGIVLAISAVVGAFEAYSKAEKEAQKNTVDFGKTIIDTNTEIKEALNLHNAQITSMRSLVAIATDYTTSEDTRNEALKRIKSTLSSVNKEEADKLKTTQDLIGASYLYIEALKAQQLAEVTGKRIAELDIQLEEDRNLVKSKGKDGFTLMQLLGISDRDVEVAEARIAQTVQLKDRLEDLNKSATTQSLKNPFSTDNTSGGNTKKAQEDKTNLELLKSKQAFYKDDIYMYSFYADEIVREEGRLEILKAKENKAGSDVILRIQENTAQKLLNNEKTLGLELAKIDEKQAKDDEKQAKDDEKALEDIQIKAAQDNISRIEENLRLEEELANKDFDKKKVALKKAMSDISESMNGVDNAKAIEMYTKALDKLSNAEKMNDAKQTNDTLNKQEQEYKKFAQTLSKDVANGLMSVFDALGKGKDPIEAIGNAFLHIGEQIAAVIVEASILEALMSAMPELKGAFAAIGAVSSAVGYSGPHANGGITNGPSFGLIGEAGPEAIMPLSKLGNVVNNSFSAGAMSGGGSSSGGQFVLRGQDLLVALNRTQKSSALKGQNISLA